MPVILEAGAYATWLDPMQTDAAKVQPFLRPYPADQMTAYPVSRLVNNARNDDPRCLEPQSDDGPQPG
jgi:putative SOS response-associated peptidase YedK